MPDAALFAMVTVHCFFHCGQTRSGLTPQDAHDRMEAHYERDHRLDVARLLGEAAPPRRSR